MMFPRLTALALCFCFLPSVISLITLELVGGVSHTGSNNVRWKRNIEDSGDFVISAIDTATGSTVMTAGVYVLYPAQVTGTRVFLIDRPGKYRFDAWDRITKVHYTSTPVYTVV